jgi:hypothetical protein
MAKQRHPQEPEETSSKGTLALIGAGTLLVAGLVVWALTRTVESPAPTASSTYASSDSAPIPPLDTTVPLAPPSATMTTPPTTTAGIATSSHAPVIEGNKAEVKRIAAEDLREKLKAGSVTIVDVRPASAYEAAHIPGSLNIPLASVEANLDRLPRGHEIVTYCT